MIRGELFRHRESGYLAIVFAIWVDVPSHAEKAAGQEVLAK